MVVVLVPEQRTVSNAVADDQGNPAGPIAIIGDEGKV
jgi:hypothetical protein